MVTNRPGCSSSAKTGAALRAGGDPKTPKTPEVPPAPKEPQRPGVPEVPPAPLEPQVPRLPEVPQPPQRPETFPPQQRRGRDAPMAAQARGPSEILR
jgi:hypothetical protein